MIWIWSNWAKECLNVVRAREHTYISQMGMKKLFYIFKTIIPLLPNSLRSRLVKLGPRMTRRGPKNYTSSPAVGNHLYNSQVGIQIWFHLWKWRIWLFKNNLHSGLTRVNPKTVRIWSKWAKECLNVTSTREPTCISQIGIKKLFYIF